MNGVVLLTPDPGKRFVYRDEMLLESDEMIDYLDRTWHPIKPENIGKLSQEVFNTHQRKKEIT
jgi:hypothetical protein